MRVRSFCICHFQLTTYAITTCHSSDTPAHAAGRIFARPLERLPTQRIWFLWIDCHVSTKQCLALRARGQAVGPAWCGRASLAEVLRGRDRGRESVRWSRKCQPSNPPSVAAKPATLMPIVEWTIWLSQAILRSIPIAPRLLLIRLRRRSFGGCSADWCSVKFMPKAMLIPEKQA